MRFKVSAVLPTPADVYFLERDSSAFRSLVARMSNLESLEMGKNWMDGDAEVYEFITKPDIEKYVPHQFKHFIPGGDLHYMDIIKYDPKCIQKSPYKMHVTSIPPIFPSKAKIDSYLTIEEETTDTCRQTLEGTIEIKIMGLGHVVERIIVDNLHKVYKSVPKIVERWVAFRDEVLKHPGGRDVLVRGRPQNLGVNWINEKLQELLKEDIDNSETESSDSGTNYDRLPTVEEMDRELNLSQRTSASLASDDSEDDVFYDAREQTSWLDLSQIVQQAAPTDARLERQMRRDTEDAAELLNRYKESGRKLQKVHLDRDPQPHSPRPEKAGATRVDSARFGSDYNRDLKEWDQFWEKQEVAQTKQHKHLKARLANVFRVGADSGLIKAQKSSEHKELKSKESKGKRSLGEARRSKDLKTAGSRESKEFKIPWLHPSHYRKKSAGSTEGFADDEQDLEMMRNLVVQDESRHRPSLDDPAPSLAHAPTHGADEKHARKDHKVQYEK